MLLIDFWVQVYTEDTIGVANTTEPNHNKTSTLKHLEQQQQHQQLKQQPLDTSD